MMSWMPLLRTNLLMDLLVQLIVAQCLMRLRQPMIKYNVVASWFRLAPGTMQCILHVVLSLQRFNMQSRHWLPMIKGRQELLVCLMFQWV